MDDTPTLYRFKSPRYSKEHLIAPHGTIKKPNGLVQFGPGELSASEPYSLAVCIQMERPPILHCSGRIKNPHLPERNTIIFDTPKSMLNSAQSSVSHSRRTVSHRDVSP